MILFLFKIDIKIKPVLQGLQLKFYVHNRDQEKDLD